MARSLVIYGREMNRRSVSESKEINNDLETEFMRGLKTDRFHMRKRSSDKTKRKKKDPDSGIWR